MKRLFALLICLSASVVLSGCQCFPATDKYGDLIDDVSDHSFCLDALYHPTLDLNRIGRPDWCQSPLNRAWCSFACGGRCRACSGNSGTTYQQYEEESVDDSSWQ